MSESTTMTSAPAEPPAEEARAAALPADAASPGGWLARSGSGDERLRLAVEALAGYVYDHDVASGNVERSDGFLELMGWAPADAPSSAAWWQSLIHPEDWTRVGPVLAERLADPACASVALEYRVRHRDGHWRWISDRQRFVRDRDGRVVRVVGGANDITARVEAEVALRRSEALLREAQASAHVGSWEWDVATDRVTWSEELYRIYGVAPGSDVSYETFIACVHPDDRNAVDSAVRQAYETGETFSLEHRVVRPDGEVRTLHGRGRVVRDASGRPVQMVGSGQDITERARSRADADFLLALGAALQQGAIAHDEGALRLEATRRLSEHLGLAQCRFVAMPHATDEGAPSHDWPEPEASGGEAVSATVPIRRAGRLVDLLELAGEEPRAWTARDFALAREVGERLWPALEAARALAAERRARDELALAEEHLRTALEAGALGSWVFDVPARHLWWSEEMERICGLALRSLDETLAAAGSLVEPVQLEGLWAAIGDTIAQGAASFRLDIPFTRTDGANRWLDVRGRTEYSAPGVPRRLIGVAADVTERREVEAQLREAMHQAELARLSAERANRAKSDFLAVMSHELRTPLNAIAGHVQLVELEIHGPVTDAQRRALERVNINQQHLLRLINDLLNLARIETGKLEYDLRDASLAQLLAEVMPMVEPQFAAKRITCAVNVSPDCIVRVDPEKAQQVLINLLGNGAKFTPHGGRVTIDAATRAEAPPDMVFVRVHDTGPGIPADMLEAIFEPFVQVDTSRTRRIDGAGLGLAISRDLARGMGGDVRARSTEGMGSTFTLTLRRGLGPGDRTDFAPESPTPA